jgi:hypothetical protein
MLVMVVSRKHDKAVPRAYAPNRNAPLSAKRAPIFQNNHQSVL